MLAAAAVLPFALVGLTACRTNVGTAATIDGHKISESDVAQYLTPNAEEIPEQDQTTGAVTPVPARAWILRTLLDERLTTDLLAQSPGGAPSDADIAAAQQALLQGTPVSDVADQYAKHGYKRDFAQVYLRSQTLGQILAQKAQSGFDVRSAIDRLRPSVSVNPRYGSWNATTFQLQSDTKAGLPDFLTVGPGATYTQGAPSASAAGAGTGGVSG